MTAHDPDYSPAGLLDRILTLEIAQAMRTSAEGLLALPREPNFGLALAITLEHLARELLVRAAALRKSAGANPQVTP